MPFIANGTDPASSGAGPGHGLDCSALGVLGAGASRHENQPGTDLSLIHI